MITSSGRGEVWCSQCQALSSKNQTVIQTGIERLSIGLNIQSQNLYESKSPSKAWKADIQNFINKPEGKGVYTRYPLSNYLHARSNNHLIKPSQIKSSKPQTPYPCSSTTNNKSLLLSVQVASLGRKSPASKAVGNITRVAAGSKGISQITVLGNRA